MEDEHSLPLSDQDAKTLLFAVKKGQPGKALRRLDAATQAPPTPASWASAMQKLAPHDHPAVPAGIVDPELWHPAEAAWQTAAGKLKDSKALDPGGWSHEAVKAIWRSPGARTKLVRWLDQLMWESDEHMLQLLHVHRPVLLSKPGTDAVRPILISTVWHKLMTSAVTLTLRPLLLPAIEDTQFGVGAAAGADNLYCRLATLAQQYPEEVFVQLDMSNAFGNISRQTVLQALQRLMPQQCNDLLALPVPSHPYHHCCASMG